MQNSTAGSSHPRFQRGADASTSFSKSYTVTFERGRRSPSLVER